MTLAQMQARFFELKGKLAVGQVNEEEFKRELEKLRFQDAQGRWWMIGAQSGRWYYYDGARWLLGDPPEPHYATSTEPVAVISPPRQDPSPVSATTPRSPTATAPRPTPSQNDGAVSAQEPITTTYRYASPPSQASASAAPATPAPVMPPPAAITPASASILAPSLVPSPPAPAAPKSQPTSPAGGLTLGETLRHDLAKVHLPHVPMPHLDRSTLHAPNLHIPPQVVPHAPGPLRRYQPNFILLGAVLLGLALVAILWLAVDTLVPDKPISTFFTRALGGSTTNRPAARNTSVPTMTGQNVDNLLRKGDELVASSQFGPAMDQYQAAAKQAPNEADVYTHWARALALTGRIGEAIQTAQRATKLDPTSSRAFAELSRAQAWAGQNNPAINNGQKAVELDPQNANAHAFLAEAYLRAGRHEAAQNEADTALELDDANPETHRAAGWVAIIANRKDEGLGEWKRVIELAPGLFLFHYELGLVYANHLDDSGAAIPAFRRALELYPPYIPSYTALGRAYLQAHQPAPAILQFQKALTLDPNSTEAFVGLGDAFRMSEKCPQAIPYYQKALELAGQPTSPTGGLAAATQGLANCAATTKGQPSAEPPPQPTPGLSVLPTAVVQATVVPLAQATPTPKVQTKNTVANPAGANGKKGRLVFPVYDGQYRIYSANPDGSDRQLVAELASSPAFSPDGSRILYYSWVNDQRGIHRVDRSGADDRHISLYAEDTLPSWSPDGARYVYATRAGQGADISKRAYSIRISSTGAKPRQGPPPLIEQAQYPTWGPSGRIAFRDCGFPDQVCGIAVANADGSGKKKLIPDNINATAPAWSPDGNQIVFMSNLVGNWDIYIVSAEGGSPIRLTDDLADEGLPTFSADGKAIAFVSKREGQWGIYAMDLDGENERKLFELGGELGGPVPGNSAAQPGQVWWEQRISWR